MNEISSSALLDIQITLLGVCGLDSFIPELEQLEPSPPPPRAPDIWLEPCSARGIRVADWGPQSKTPSGSGRRKQMKRRATICTYYLGCLVFAGLCL